MGSQKARYGLETGQRPETWCDHIFLFGFTTVLGCRGDFQWLPHCLGSPISVGHCQLASSCRYLGNLKTSYKYNAMLGIVSYFSFFRQVVFAKSYATLQKSLGSSQPFKGTTRYPYGTWKPRRDRPFFGVAQHLRYRRVPPTVPAYVRCTRAKWIGHRSFSRVVPT